MTGLLMIVVGAVALLLMIVEMLTYSTGDGGVVSRTYRKNKTFFKCVLVILVGAILVWRGNFAAMMFGLGLLVWGFTPLIKAADRWSQSANKPLSTDD